MKELSRSDIQKQLESLTQRKDERIFSFYLRVQEVALTTSEMKPLTVNSTASKKLVAVTKWESDFRTMDHIFFEGLKKEFKDYVRLWLDIYKLADIIEKVDVLMEYVEQLEERKKNLPLTEIKSEEKK